MPPNENYNPHSRKRPKRGRHSSRPKGVYLLVGLLSFLAISALFGGGALIIDPSGDSLDMPVALLAGTRFRDYLVPAIILFGLFGVLPLAVVLALLLRPRWGWLPRIGVHASLLAAIGVGAALIIWILVQMTSLRFFLQPIILVLGAVIIGVSLAPAVRAHYRERRSSAL